MTIAKCRGQTQRLEVQPAQPAKPFCVGAPRRVCPCFGDGVREKQLVGQVDPSGPGYAAGGMSSRWTGRIRIASQGVTSLAFPASLETLKVVPNAGIVARAARPATGAARLAAGAAATAEDRVNEVLVRLASIAAGPARGSTRHRATATRGSPSAASTGLGSSPPSVVVAEDRVNEVLVPRAAVAALASDQRSGDVGVTSVRVLQTSSACMQRTGLRCPYP